MAAKAGLAQTHPATVVEVHDGDTIKVAARLARNRGRDQDLGFHVYRESGWLVLHALVRLLGCNARELSQPGGVEARDHLAALLPVGKVVTLTTVGADKFARWDAKVLADGVDLVQQLIDDEWLAPWDGTGERPLPPWPRTKGD